MFFNSALLMMETQSRAASMVGDLMIAYSNMHYTGMVCTVQAMGMFFPQQTVRIKFPAMMNPVISRDGMMVAIERAENEGMGTAIASSLAKAEIEERASYESSCNRDAQVPEAESVVAEKSQGIKKWFSENAVACEQDIFDDRLRYRRVYSGVGQTPNAPSALAVLERHRARGYKIHAA